MGILTYSVIAVMIMLCLYRPSSFIYFPFSVGPRTCIGKNFGMVRLLVAMKFKSTKVVFTIDGG